MAAEAAASARKDQVSSGGRPGLLVTRAPAKVNLTLHVVGRRADGYHALESLVAFAGASDTLSLDAGGELTLTVGGMRAAAAGPDADNLVLKAAHNLAQLRPGLRQGAFTLVKRLPVAAGIGGGSSDAAAALRLLARANDIPLDDPSLREAARRTGSDVPVCLDPRARMMRGAGEDLGPALHLPPLFAVLVNPGTPVATASVFRGMGLTPGEASGYGAHPRVETGMAADDLWPLLRRARNDMEAAACVMAPAIGDVLAVLAASRSCRLARMSGSGATCFGLFETCRAASHAARAIRSQHPGWWVKATALR
jgi:4-diphosphocytidyl-2-C-methyl-D-erythritol kinase